MNGDAQGVRGGSTSGANVLGQVVGVLAALESLRAPGGLSTFFANRAAAVSDPDVRAALEGSPFTAGFYGVGGRDYEPFTVPAGFPGGPRIPGAQPGDRVPGGFRPALPPLGPNALMKQLSAQMGLDLTRARTEKARRDIEAQDRAAAILGRFLPGLGGAGGGGGGDVAAPASSDLAFDGLTVDPTTGRVQLALKAPKTRQVVSGTINPATGQPYQPRERGPRGEPIEITPGAGAKLGVGLDRQVKSLDASLAAYTALFGDRPDGSSPFDVLPSGDTAGAIESQMADIPVIGAFTRGGRFGRPSAKSIELLAKEGNEDARAILSGGGLRAVVARMTGEVGNLNETEQKVVADAFLPNKTDTKVSAQQKRDIYFRTAKAIREGLVRGKLSPADAKALLFQGASEAAGQQLTPETTGEETVPAPRGATLSKEQLDADAALLGIP